MPKDLDQSLQSQQEQCDLGWRTALNTGREHLGNYQVNLDFLEQTALLHAGDHCLEIGCGIGSIAAALQTRGLEVIGTDISQEAISYGCDKYPELCLEVQPAEVLPYADQSFDLVLSFDLFEHVAQIDRHVAEVKRVLKPNGYYLLQTPNKFSNVVFETLAHRSLSWRRYHPSLHSPGQLQRRFRKHGFSVRFIKMNPINDFTRNKLKRFGILGRGISRLPFQRMPMTLQTNLYAVAQLAPESDNGKPCPTCGGIGDKDRHVDGYDLLKCRVCGFVYVDVSDEAIQQENLHYDGDTVQHYEGLQSGFDRMWFGKITDRLVAGREGLKVLDVGCGNGLLLRQFQQRGCVCYGSDPSPWAKQCADKYGYEVLGLIEQAGIEDNFFDIVTSTSTLEHLARPFDYVKEIVRILKPGGAAYFTVPNYGSLPVRMRWVKGRLVTPPGHCSYFAARTLRDLFLRQGLGEQLSRVKVRSYGIPESYGIYQRLSRLRPKPVQAAKPTQAAQVTQKAKGSLVKNALVNGYYWGGAGFGLGDKLEAWIEKKP